MNVSNLNNATRGATAGTAARQSTLTLQHIDGALPQPSTPRTRAGTGRNPLGSIIQYRRLAAVVLLAGLVGCGTTTGDRAVSGAGIGAGAGAALGAVTGMGVGTGAAIGAAAGAAAGGLTDKDEVNLGKPIWR